METALILVVATFHSLGLTWSPPGGAAGVACEVRYRIEGEPDWHRGLPLWFDARDGEYRGSLVSLRPGTRYEIELALEDGTRATARASTWSEDFPIARRVEVEDARSLVIDEGGTPDGYVLYEGGVIDASGDDEGNAVTVRASYVILRGMTVRGGRHGIKLEGAHDVVIDESDISGWGHVEPDGFGDNEDAAVRCQRDTSVERVVVQRSRIHHPRSDSNSWGEYRDDWGTSHPIGPQAVQFDTCGGNHVFRYNDIYSDDDHRFQDAIGGSDNFTDHGFPQRDSDIYGNRISHCWDDAIEAEGANENVRIWGNYMERTYVMIAAATTSVGPLYVFRNVAGESQYEDGVPRDEADHGPFLKLGGRDPYYGGRIYVFHNTTLQPRDPEGVATYGIGVGGAISDSGAPLLEQIVSRNNVFTIHKTWWSVIDDGRRSATNDFDYDLYNGRVQAYDGAEPNGIEGEPIFAADGISLDPSSPGFDRGVALPGFNDGWEGAAPDLGAQETGAPPAEYGIDAYRTSPAVPDPPAMPEDDAGSVTRDAGTIDPLGTTDAGIDDAPPTALRGCGCNVVRGAPARAPGWSLAALTALAIASRRRSRSRVVRAARA